MHWACASVSRLGASFCDEWLAASGGQQVESREPKMVSGDEKGRGDKVDVDSHKLAMTGRCSDCRAVKIKKGI